MKALLLTLLLASPALAQDAADATGDSSSEDAVEDARSFEGSAVAAGITLRVSDKKAAAEATIAAADALGGWFTHFDTARVDVRVPTDKTDALLEALVELGEVVDRSYQRQDHSQELAELDARIAGREKILERYREVLTSAKAASVVSVERQITSAVSELEGLKGRRRFLQNRLAHSTVQVSFQFRDRSAPRRDGSSSFAWLNTMNMADLLTAFRHGWRSDRSRVDVPVPDGFAPFRKRGRFQAVSPDDVVYRVRSAKNKPEADLEFWAEALKERQEAAGYTVTGEQTVDGTYILELGAANGAQDQTYVVGLRVAGSHLILAEATGEAEAFLPHRDAIVASMTGME